MAPTETVPVVKLRPGTITLSKLESELHRLHGGDPLNLHNDGISITAGKKDQFCYYEVTYKLSATDERQRKVCTAKLTLVATYTTETTITEADLQANSNLVLRHLHDYLREQMHWLTMQMGLPPLVLDVFRMSAD